MLDFIVLEPQERIAPPGKIADSEELGGEAPALSFRAHGRG